MSDTAPRPGALLMGPAAIWMFFASPAFVTEARHLRAPLSLVKRIFLPLDGQTCRETTNPIKPFD
jgi:hypothetical protein